MTAKTKAESPPTMDIVLKTLAERRTALDKLDDKLSILIQRIESVLRRQVSTRITQLLNENTDEFGELEFLTFGKHDGKFMLLLERGVQRRNSTIHINNSTPLLSSSREIRTLVFAEGHVERLLRSAHEQLSAQIAMRERALAAAEHLADALGPLSAMEDFTPDSSADDDELPF